MIFVEIIRNNATHLRTLSLARSGRGGKCGRGGREGARGGRYTRRLLEDVLLLLVARREV